MPELRVRCDDLALCELVDGEPARDEVGEGEAQLRIERFALTTNNVTYGVLGEQLGYWRRFPAEDGWGRIPAWGYARVAASGATGIAEGTRVFGFLPMASRITMRPVPHPLGFRDTSADLNPIYIQYLAVDDAAEDAALVWRPLFGTSVMLDLDLSENGLPDTVVLTSASSKTALGLAHLLRGRPVRIAGLTSPQRTAWVEDLGLYDDVLGYDDLDRLDAGDDAVLVDFTGVAEGLLRLERISTGEGLIGAYRDLLEGRADPGVARIVALP